MPGYLIIQALTATVFMLVSLVVFDASLWVAACWYVIGSWSGMAVMLLGAICRDAQTDDDALTHS